VHDVDSTAPAAAVQGRRGAPDERAQRAACVPALAAMRISQGGGAGMAATAERTRDPARWVAAAAGGFLVWRAAFGRGLARLPTAVAGAALVRRALGRRSPGRAAHREGGHAEAARTPAQPEVIEVKSPAELEPGVRSASPEPTFSNRVDRGPRVESEGGSAAPDRRGGAKKRR